MSIYKKLILQKNKELNRKIFLESKTTSIVKLKFVLNLSFFGCKNQFTILREK